MTRALPVHRLVAINTATSSENKIHDDEVAGRLGFTGGLVPGVDVYAYLCRIPLEHWGAGWLTGGTGTVRFSQPVYDGDEVEVRGELDDDEVLTVEAHTAAGRRARLAAARTGADAPLHVLVPTIDRQEPPRRPGDRPPASAELFAARPTLATLTVRCDDDEHQRYLDDVRDQHSPTTELGACHPGWVLRRANQVLVASVALGPWIHVASTVQHLRPVPRGTDLEVRARVRDAREHNGHRLVDLDVVITDPDGPAVVIDHQAIYEPRQLRSPG